VPSGIAIIGTGNHPATLEQHYYDSRGVARIYQMMSLNGACGRYAEGDPFCPEPSNAATLGALWSEKPDPRRYALGVIARTPRPAPDP
jgi:hypothetical protein